MAISSLFARGGVALGVGVALAAPNAFSQQLEEVVVTARKQTESLMEVPLAVSVFSGARLDQIGAAGVIDIKHYIPGFHYSDRGNLQTEITIRGVGGNARNIGVDSGVGMYVDGVYAGRTSSYNQDLIDIERVEVLRGPQGTLFGKNTTGGAVNIISRKPTDEYEGRVDLTAGRFNEVRARAVLGGPLSDTVFGKLTAATWDRDGYLDNIAPKPQSPLVEDEYQSEQRRSGRVQLRFVPSDELEINLAGDYTQDDRDAVLNQVITDLTTGRKFKSDEVSVDQKNRDERDMWGASAQIDYRLNDCWSLVSISGYRDTEIEVYSDIDQLPIDIAHSGPFTDDAKIFTQEFRAAYAGDGPLSGILGVYYFDQDTSAYRYIVLQGSPIIDDHSMDVKSYAAFGNVDYAFTDATVLTLGLRYTDEERDADYDQQSPRFFNLQTPLKVDSSEWSWTTSLRHNWSDDLSTYISASKGFKSGGMDLDTSVGPITPDALVFKPEFVTNYEIGVKGELFDGRARFSAAAFFSEYDDRQVTQFLDFGEIIAVPTTRNAGEAEIKGLEFEAQVVFTDRLSAWGNFAITDGEYTDFDNADAAGNSYTHNTTERTPENSGGLGLEYRLPVGGGELVLYGDLTYTGDTELQADNLPIHRQDGYTLYNARAGYEFASNKLSIYAWGKNLGDEEYLEFSRVFLGNQQVLYGMPRTYGIDFQWHFL